MFYSEFPMLVMVPTGSTPPVAQTVRSKYKVSADLGDPHSCEAIREEPPLVLAMLS